MQQASSNKILSFWQGVKPPSGIESHGFVDRKIAPVDLRMPARGTWRKQVVDMEGISLFLDPLSSSVAQNLETRFWTNRGYAHPEPLNHPILISRTVRRTYPTYIPSFYVPACPARYIFGRMVDKARIRIRRICYLTLSERSLIDCGTLYIIELHYSSPFYLSE